jgi:hypothetical protein
MEKVRCDVCGREGLFVEVHLPGGPESGETRSTAQCPRCRRFICSRHFEPLPGGRLGCPFDPGVTLGDAEVLHGPSQDLTLGYEATDLPLTPSSRSSPQ